MGIAIPQESEAIRKGSLKKSVNAVEEFLRGGFHYGISLVAKLAAANRTDVWSYDERFCTHLPGTFRSFAAHCQIVLHGRFVQPAADKNNGVCVHVVRQGLVPRIRCDSLPRILGGSECKALP